MQIIYNGKTAKGRRIPVGDSFVQAKKGKPVEVPDAIGEALLGPDWSRADAEKTKAKKAGKGDE